MPNHYEFNFSLNGNCQQQTGQTTTQSPFGTTTTRRAPLFTGFPGDSCDQNTLCIGSSRCQVCISKLIKFIQLISFQNGICQCEPGYETLNGALSCLPSTGTSPSTNSGNVPPGSPCTPGVTFCRGGSQCQFGYCLCPVGQVRLE